MLTNNIDKYTELIYEHLESIYLIITKQNGKCLYSNLISYCHTGEKYMYIHLKAVAVAQ